VGDQVLGICRPTGRRGQRYREAAVIVLGVIALILGFVLHIPILWTLGIVLMVIGVILAVLGGMGRAVGGRSHYFSRCPR